MKELIVNYFDNGLIKEKGVLINGLKEGVWTYYYENGKLYKEITYEKGIESGLWRMWGENGNINIIQNKKNGDSDGLWEEYYENGEIKEKGFYCNGEYLPKDFWDEKGNHTLVNGTGKKTEWFGANNNEVSEFYFLDGILIKEVKTEQVRYRGFKENNDDL